MTRTTDDQPTRRTQASRRDESDNKMLRAASHLISRQGVRATTLAEIGLAAGYSSGLPAVRYGSKLGLIHALLESMDRWWQATFTAATAGRSGLAALTARIDAYIGGAKSIPEGAAALQAILVEARYSMPELQPRIADLTEHWRQGFRDDLREAQRLGEVNTDIDCELYAELILGAARGMMIDRLGQDLADLQQTLPPLLSGLMRGAAP
jgi:AcrR family transcriptional regulator